MGIKTGKLFPLPSARIAELAKRLLLAYSGIMQTPNNKLTYTKNELTAWSIPSYSDFIALILVLGVLVLFALAAKAMVGEYQIGQEIPISLDPRNLPYYALRTILRMFAALTCSLLFTFVFGTWAAKSKSAERIIIPLIDIMQSVPILGFLSITVTLFIALFSGSLLGPECAAIFAIFTAQVWNITLSLYQSLRGVPQNLIEVATLFQLSAWQRFWRIEVPFSASGLVWNCMISMSTSWVFLVAAEAITVDNHNITLPGIGSYIALAIKQADQEAIWFVIITMFLVIALYDQLLFRPLLVWIERFKEQSLADEVFPESWVLDLFQRSRWTAYLRLFFSRAMDAFINIKYFRYKPYVEKRESLNPRFIRWLHWFWCIALAVLVVVLGIGLLHFIFEVVPFSETKHVIYLGFVTTLRITVLVIISSIIWVPIGVWIGLNPRASQMIQPVVQFAAAFPANLLFPIVVYFIVKDHLNVNIWTSPLMILGTQWYLLFNVIAGATELPQNVRQAVRAFNVKGSLWWRRFIIPGIFPYYITGAVTAAGGAWNISIIAESVSWGDTHLQATGLGAYIAEMANSGEFQKLALGIMVMSLYVLAINRLVWRPLYNLAIEHYRV